MLFRMSSSNMAHQSLLLFSSNILHSVQESLFQYFKAHGCISKLLYMYLKSAITCELPTFYSHFWWHLTAHAMISVVNSISLNQLCFLSLFFPLFLSVTSMAFIELWSVLSLPNNPSPLRKSYFNAFDIHRAFGWVLAKLHTYSPYLSLIFYIGSYLVVKCAGEDCSDPHFTCYHFWQPILLHNSYLFFTLYMQVWSTCNLKNIESKNRHHVSFNSTNA